MVFPALVGKTVLALLSLASKASSLGENKRGANQQLAISRNAQASSSTAILVPSAHWLDLLVTSVPSVVVSIMSPCLTCMHVYGDFSSAPFDRPPAWLGQSLSEHHRAFWCVGQSGNGWQFPRCAGRHEQIGKDRLKSLLASFNHH